MSGEKDLSKLISSMQPVLSEIEYVFVSLDEGNSISLGELKPLGTFYEEEGLTVILSKTVPMQLVCLIKVYFSVLP